MLKVRAIVNPSAAGGRTGRRWPRMRRILESAVPGIDTQITAARGEATELTRTALRSGIDVIVAVGGDGTVNECVNGFFDGGEPIKPEAALAVVASGTGQDFRRALGSPGTAQAVAAAIAQGRPRRLDLGLAGITLADGSVIERYFCNAASFGFSGAVNEVLERQPWLRRLGGRVAFFMATLAALTQAGGRRVAWGVDGQQPQAETINTVALANGARAGGGMRIAPHALPDDGRFDVVRIAAMGRAQLLLQLPRVYRGSHLDHPAVRSQQAQRVEARPADDREPVLVECDGELVGRLPARFELLPGALRVYA